MVYTSADAPVRKSVDLESTETANAGRYESDSSEGESTTVRLARCNGVPVAFRRVRVMNAGSFAHTKVQAVTPAGCTALPESEAERLHGEATVPLN